MPAAAERFGGLPPKIAAPGAAAVGLSFAALFFSGGFADAPLVWIGGLALLAAGLTAAAVLARLLPGARLATPALVFLGCFAGLVVWVGVTTTWSLSPDRSWAYTNRTFAYLGFAVLGLLVAVLLPRVAVAAGALAALVAAVIGWALLAKCVPALFSDYGRVARLRAPVAYWNELALLCVVAVPLALWLATPRAGHALRRAAGVLLLFAATVALLLTYSRVGVVLACAAAAGWIVLDRERVEGLAALALGAGPGVAVFGAALLLPGITKDGRSHAVRAHDGWIFALVLVAAGAVVFAVAVWLAGLDARRELAPERRRRVERVAGLAAAMLVVAGIAASAAVGGRVWHEFTNPVSSQINSSPTRLGSASSSNRWRWWGEEWQAFTAHPAGGTGAGTFLVTDLRLRRSELRTDEPHNTPLQFLGETGIVGLLLYLGVAAAAIVAVVRVRRRAAGAERAAVTALALGLAAFLLHMVVDMDWNFVATCGPLLLVTGFLVGRDVRADAATAPAAAPRRPGRRPILAAGVVALALVGCYSLAAPWLSQRQLANAADIAALKRAHTWNPLSTPVLVEWAVFEDASGNTFRAQDLYREALSLEPQNSEVWNQFGIFYREHGDAKAAYEAFDKAWTYDRYGVWAEPCGSLDRARHAVYGVWPPSCPRGRPRAASP